MADAGWYADPQDPNAEQFWDGQSWSGQRRGVARSGSGAAPETAINPIYQASPIPPPAQQAGYGSQQGYAAQPGYGSQPGYAPQPGYGSQPGYAPQPGYGSQPGYAGPPAAKKSRRRPLIAGGAAVVVVAAGLVTWLAWPGADAPSLTYQGKAIDGPAKVLSSAETIVNQTVTSRHGAKNSDTRCYFAQSEKPASGTKKSDISNNLTCGPVLFVDGNRSAEYLPVALTSAGTSGGKTKLVPRSSLDGVPPTTAPAGEKLVRPDGKTAPSGDGGLSVPQPPAATKDTIAAVSLGSTTPPASLSGAVIVGRTSKVTVTSAGFVNRYGSGDAARSAPSGQRLLAFRAAYAGGELSDTSTAQVSLIVDGTSRSIPQAAGDQYVVAAVPSASTTVLQVTDSGATQQLELPSGQPGSNNIAVLRRSHRTALIGQKFNVKFAVSKGSQQGSATVQANASVASLDYWPPADVAIMPSKPSNGFLTVRVNYTDSADPGKTFGFDSTQLTLKLPDGTVLRARNVAPSGKISNVFEVPATFTSGVVTISGSSTESGGITTRIVTARSFTVSIPAN